MGNYISKDDIDNWPAGYDDTDKNEVISRIEKLLERWTETHFYAKNFDISINGNGKNRLFPNLDADIISISHLYVCNSELPESWYSFDADSVYLELCGSGALGAGDPELYYKLADVEISGLFPRGYNNIQIVGTCGNTALLSLAKEICRILITAENDPKTYKRYFKSERIGTYQYEYPGVGAMIPSEARLYSGIREADELIDQIVSDKPFIGTP